MAKFNISVSAFAITVFLHFAQVSYGNEQDIQNTIKIFDNALSQEDYRTKHKAALEAINQINTQADTSKSKLSNANEKTAIDDLRIGYINSIKCIAVAGDQAYQGNQNAAGQYYSENAIQSVIQGVDNAMHGVLVAQMAVLEKLGLAAARTGNYAAQQLRNSTKYVTLAGKAANSGLKELQELSKTGIQSGGPAKIQSLKAANEGVEATGAVYYNNLLKSAQIAFGGVDKSILAIFDNTNSADAAAKRSPEAKSIIQAVSNAAETAKSQPNAGFSGTAASVDLIRNGAISAIKSIALAIEQQQRVQISTQSSIASNQQIAKATDQVKNDFAYAAAYVHQNLGIVDNLVGCDFDEAIKAVEEGCSAAFKSLEVARFLALSGLDNGSAATETGLTAARDALINSGFVAYTRFYTAANIAFDVLRTCRRS